MKLIRTDVMKLILPVITEQVFIILMGVINTIMASNVGKDAVSAIGMVDSISNIFITFFSALAVGGTVVVAHYSGQGKREEANESVKQALYSGLFLAIMVTTAIWIFKLPIIRLLYGSAEESVVANALNYMNIILFSFPLIAITSVALGTLRGSGDTRTPMKVTITMNIINVLTSYIMIYGLKFKFLFIHMNFQGYGVRGAALGLTSARLIGAVFVIFVLIKGSKNIKLNGIFKVRFDMDIQKSIFSIGIPASVESILFNCGKLMTQVLIVGMGTASIASNYIANSILSMVNIPGSSLTVAATTLVGQSMGRGEDEEAASNLKYLVFFAASCLTVLSLISLPLARTLVSLYNKDPEIIRITTSLIRLSAVFTPVFWAMSFVLPAGLKGAGDVKYTMCTSIFGMWVFRITLGYILGVPLKLGVAGVWLGMFTDWVVRGTLYVFRFRSGKWKYNKVIKSNTKAVKA